jgi:hypothetical protein
MTFYIRAGQVTMGPPSARAKSIVPECNLKPVGGEIGLPKSFYDEYAGLVRQAITTIG